MQPGDTITPAGGQPEPSAQPPLPTPAPEPAPAPPVEAPQPVTPTSPEPIKATEPETIPSYNQPIYETDKENLISPPQTETVSWSASEFIEHEKPHGWYAILAVGAVLLAAILYFLVRDVITVVVVSIAAILLGVVAARKPKSMDYSLSQAGLRIGEKNYPYSTFKSFSMIEEGAIDSIQLMPLKRIVPPVSIYFPPEQGDQIFEILAAYLPHEDREHDPLDKLMRRLHF